MLDLYSTYIPGHPMTLTVKESDILREGCFQCWSYIYNILCWPRPRKF